MLPVDKTLLTLLFRHVPGPGPRDLNPDAFESAGFVFNAATPLVIPAI
jgi:hypothetical protein